MTALSICASPTSGVRMPLRETHSGFIGDVDPLQTMPDTSRRETGDQASRKSSVILIDGRILARECLRNSLVSYHAPWDVVACSSMEEWREQADRHPPLAAVLLHIGPDKVGDPSMEETVKRLIGECGSAPLIIMADRDDAVQVLNAFEFGARGYIPSSVSVGVCVEAINLALAGGVFVPASTVVAMRGAIPPDFSYDRRLTQIFTSRQIEVAKAIWEGKPNKIIAYELEMCESTVKVHIRNIMRKLKVNNRTEAAYKVSNLFASHGVAL